MKVQTLLLLQVLATFAVAIIPGDAESAFTTLLQWYNESTGHWIPSTGWWNSANGLHHALIPHAASYLMKWTALTTIADLAQIDVVVAAQAQAIYPNTLVKAQQYNLQLHKEVDSASLIHSYHGDHAPRAYRADGFLNDYDATGQKRYLLIAESIFHDIAKAYGTTPCGGVWWNKAQTYVNAIANELFMDVAAHLANRAGRRAGYYLDWAITEWQWFQSSGLINAGNLINDGLTNECENNGKTTWSYNQGVILGALTELSRATGDDSYIITAKTIADAAITNLTDANGVLHDVCEPNCGGDGSQFKGVFARNLQVLQEASPELRYQTSFETNANSIWAKDQIESELSLVWSGPFKQVANASTQSSALDCLVGALATSAELYSV